MAERRMNSKTNKLNRFTTFPVLLDMLINKHLVFSNPEDWEDRNDAELLEIYKKAKGKKSLFALCFLMEDETIHHWKAFADEISGCCIEFDRKKLVVSLAAHKDKGIKYGSIVYKKIKGLDDGAIDDCIDTVPFIKRWLYRFELEFRVIWESDTRIQDHTIKFEDIGMIKRITLSPDLPECLFRTIKTLLEGYFPQDAKPIINLSTFKRNAEWIGKFEVFDVVNDRDEVVDRKLRREVHARGLKHRAVHVLVFNSRGEVFLQKRSLKKDTAAGLWDSSTSGHLDSGEDYDACAVRELREEIGLEVNPGAVATRASPPLQKLFKIAACPETDAEFVWVYRCQAEGPFQLHPDEIERGGWFAPENITRWIAEKPGDFAGAFRLIWRKLNR